MKILCTSVVLAVATLVTAWTPAPGGVEVGEQVEYDFATDFLGAPGPASLADLRGRPVLIDFWGTR
ncbi:MAG: hypothetical protein AAFZ65_06050 [Planctomycetota bacterium]